MGTDHALIKGTLNPAEPVWVRMHAADPLYDAIGDTHGGKSGELTKAMQKIADHGSGVVVILREQRSTLISDLLALRDDSKPTKPMLRDYGTGAQILLDRICRRKSCAPCLRTGMANTGSPQVYRAGASARPLLTMFSHNPESVR